MARDHATKSDAVLEHGKVTLSTVHSVKGLEARNLVLLGADLPRAVAEGSPRRKALLCVGMTRATDRLIVPRSHPAGPSPCHGRRPHTAVCGPSQCGVPFVHGRQIPEGGTQAGNAETGQERYGRSEEAAGRCGEADDTREKVTPLRV